LIENIHCQNIRKMFSGIGFVYDANVNRILESGKYTQGKLQGVGIRASNQGEVVIHGNFNKGHPEDILIVDLVTNEMFNARALANDEN
jgi:hypothetical protein